MKPIFWAMIAMVVMGAAFGTDVLTVSDTGGQVSRILWDWTADATGTVTGLTSAECAGIVYACLTQPGTVQPTNNYDIVVKQGFSAPGGGTTVLTTDLAGGDLANRSATAAEWVSWWPDTVTPVQGYVQIVITNAGNGGKGRVELAVARGLWMQRSDASIPFTSGSVSQIAQFSSPGKAKWVDMSGEATISDGGAVLLQGSPDFTAVTASGAVTAGATVSGEQVTSTDDASVADRLTINGYLYEDVSANGAGCELRSYRQDGDAETNRGWLMLCGARGTRTSPAAITTGYRMGKISWYGHDGTDFLESACLIGRATGTIGTGRVPGKLELHTWDASGVEQTAWTVDSGQDMRMYSDLDVDGNLNCDGTGQIDLKLTLGNDLDVQGGDVNVGVADTQAGTLTLHSDASTGGGLLRLYNAPDEDGYVNVWQIEADATLKIKGIAGVTMMTFEETGNVSILSDLNVHGGAITSGQAGTERGTITLNRGTSTNTPGCIGPIYTCNGTAYYIFVEDDGTLKVHTALPTANTNGVVVGSQS